MYAQLCTWVAYFYESKRTKIRPNTYHKNNLKIEAPTKQAKIKQLNSSFCVLPYRIRLSQAHSKLMIFSFQNNSKVGEKEEKK